MDAEREHGQPQLGRGSIRAAGRPSSARGVCIILASLPLFKREGVGCLGWGLLSGKTQTIYLWESPEGAPEPALWFYGVFDRHSRPFDEREAALIRRVTVMEAVMACALPAGPPGETKYNRTIPRNRGFLENPCAVFSVMCRRRKNCSARS